MLHRAATVILTALLIAVGCAKDSEYSPEELALIKVRAAATTRRASQKPMVMHDAGAETAKPQASRCFGIEDTAARRVFIFDGSASMVQVIGGLKRQLRDAVEALDQQSAFNILIFQDDRTLALESHWVMADTIGKILANDFIEEFHAYGSSDPIPGLRKAFALNPQIIYLGTDGDFPNNAEVLATIHELNPGHKVKIHAIIYGDGGKEIEKLLKQIATETGGAFVSKLQEP